MNVTFATWEWEVGSDRPAWTDAISEVTGFAIPPAGNGEELIARHVHPDDIPRVSAAVEQMGAGNAVTYTARLRPGPDQGPDVWIRFTGQPEFDRDGQMTRMHGSIQALESSGTDGSYWHTFADAPIGMAILDTDLGGEGLILEANRALAKILGYSTQELTGRTMLELTDPRDLAETYARLGELVNDPREVASVRKRYIRADGATVHALVNVSVVREADGRPIHRIVAVQDITEALRAEEEIRASEDRYRRLVESMHEGVWASDAEGRTTFVNDRVAEMLGWSKEDFLGRAARDFVHPEDLGIADREQDLRRDGQSTEYEVRLKTSDGSDVWVSIRAVAQVDEAGNHSGGLAMLTDITDRKAADALRAELAAAVGGSADAIVTTTVDGRVRTWNAAAERIYGYSPAEASGRVLDELATPPEQRGEMALIQKRAAAGESVQLDTTRRRKDGTVLRLSLTVTPLRDVSGTIMGLTRIARDITEREAARSAVEESERRFRQIVETANEGVWVVDTDGRTVFANARMAEILGLTPRDMHGRRFVEFCVNRQAAERRFAGRPDVGAERMEIEMVHADGRPLNVLVSTGPLHDPNGSFSGALAMVVDMTARLQAEAEAADLERRLNQMQRLETVGQLAGGIAHDFNNLLSVILNYAEFALMTLEGSEVRDDIAEIKHAAERAADLTQQLLLFSRQEMVTPEVLDVNELVKSMHGLMSRTLGEHVALNVDLGSIPASVEADRSQLEQVLMNLAVNARDAMPDGGQLTISTSVVHESGQSSVRLAVSDTGEGMTDEVKERIFEPFFTTKPKGSGTGLGLATVYGIVAGAGGHITIETELQVGTTFNVDLPLSALTGTDESAELPTIDDRAGHSILVVEDEGAVRRVAIRILEAAGFSVLAAATGEEAVDIAGDPETEIDAVLTDVVMPGMPGDVVAQRLAECRPGTPVLFMSGYTEHMHRLPAGAPLIEKPFTSEVLVKRLREAIKGSHA